MNASEKISLAGVVISAGVAIWAVLKEIGTGRRLWRRWKSGIALFVLASCLVAFLLFQRAPSGIGRPETQGNQQPVSPVSRSEPGPQNAGPAPSDKPASSSVVNIENHGTGIINIVDSSHAKVNQTGAR